MEIFKKRVKNNRPHIEMKEIDTKILRKHKLAKDYKRHKILKKARKTAHDPIANSKRDISNNMRND
jgi:hypothetical protein